MGTPALSGRLDLAVVSTGNALVVASVLMRFLHGGKLCFNGLAFILFYVAPSGEQHLRYMGRHHGLNTNAVGWTLTGRRLAFQESLHYDTTRSSASSDVFVILARVRFGFHRGPILAKSQPHFRPDGPFPTGGAQHR